MTAFFADDSLIFCKANVLEWWRLSYILKLFENASGQRLNMDKTSIYFSDNTKLEIKIAFLHAANVREAKSFEKYLGLPAYVGRNKMTAFKPILESIRSRMSSWTVKLISQAGKEVLLKAIIQAIPTYCMGIFKLPRTILHAINRQVKNFWWGSRGDKTKMQWVPWNLMGTSKNVGGLGYRDFELFNVALLAKQGWRLIQNPSSLAAVVLKAKYYSRTDFLNSKIGSNASFLWKSFSEGKDVLREGLIWRIGNEESVVIGKDKWIPQASTFQIQSPLQTRFMNGRVSELIVAETKTWNSELINEIFDESEASLISKIPISPYGSPDKLIWRGTKDGKFTVKSAYHFITQLKQESLGQCSTSNSQNEVWRYIWNLKVPSASKMFLWRAAHESLPTNPNLNRRKIGECSLCPICKREEESVVHILWTCASAQDVWGSSSRKLQKMSFMPLNFKELVCYLHNRLSEEEMEIFIITVYLTWKRRNSFIFENKFDDPTVVANTARQNALDYRRVNSLSDRNRSREDQVAQLWVAPPLNKYKVNWDAAVDSINCRVGIGVVVRDWNGNVKALLMSQRNVLPDAFLAESIGAMEAVNLCRNLDMRSIILEGDAINVVKGLNGELEFWNYPGLLIQGTKSLLGSIHSWSVTYVPRLANVVAHTLAKEALKLSEERIVLEEIPHCIRNLLF